VSTDKRFGPHRGIAAASGFRAVQSTPLVDKNGHLVGVVSTHYPDPHAPSSRDLRIIRRYADLVGQLLSSRRNGQTPTNITQAISRRARNSASSPHLTHVVGASRLRPEP
jgi:GAF domain-containing protein